MRTCLHAITKFMTLTPIDAYTALLPGTLTDLTHIIAALITNSLIGTGTFSKDLPAKVR